MKYTIDAQGKKLGRIASQAAHVLLGKNTPAFQNNKVSDNQVEILNANRLDITAKKKGADKYVTYTGFRGGLKEETLGNLMERRGITEVLTRTIYRMLPKNKLRDIRIKNLIIKP